MSYGFAERFRAGPGWNAECTLMSTKIHRPEIF